MTAAVYTGHGAMAVEHRPIPEPAAGQVRIEVARCGICGTDLHLVLEHYARPGSVLGHEWCGRIAELGDGIDGWAVGDRVVAGPRDGCGECRACRTGRPAVCRQRGPSEYFSPDGAFAEYVLVDASRLVAVPDVVDDRAAALTEPLAVVLHALTLAAPLPADRVLVTGAGPLGLLVVAALRARGVENVTVSEPAPLRRIQAEKVGARRTLEPVDLPEPPMGEPVADAYDIAFECSGRADAATAALDQLDRAGILVALGTGSEAPRFNHNRMIVLELTAIGSYNYDDRGFDDALALLASGLLPVDDLLDPDDVALDGVFDAIVGSAAGRRRGKVLVDPSAKQEARNV
jgi:(R,R)-butanediol dehydrogenase/meso-butanediol dehydrogenase/diacetyl reductase